MFYFPNISPADKPKTAALFEQALQEEAKLNTLRNTLREQRNARLSNEPQTAAESISAYVDILNSFERMGDYALRLAEIILKKKLSADHDHTLNAQTK